MTTVSPLTETTLTSCVSEAREGTGNETFLSQSRCVDALLDCLNATVRPSVRDVAAEALASISLLRLVKAEDFRRALDQIEMALAVDSIFDRFDLA